MKCYGCGQELGTADDWQGLCSHCAGHERLVRTQEWDGHEIVDAGSGDFELIPADIGQAVLDLAKAVDRLATAVTALTGIPDHSDLKDLPEEDDYPQPPTGGLEVYPAYIAENPEDEP